MKVVDEIAKRPRLLFAGSMVGRNPGHITQQGQILADLFQREGYEVRSASALLNRYGRLADITTTLARHRGDVDVVVLEVYGGPSFVVEDITSWLGSRLGLPIIMWLHGGALPEFMAKFPGWTKRVLRRAHTIVTPTDFLARTVAQHGFEARIIPNVIELDSYPYRHREAVAARLFWMRSFHPIWNPNMALRVMARLRDSLPGASLVMAGPDKGSLPDVIRQTQSLGLGDRVRFAGFLDQEGKTREGGAADIYINTNHIDNAPVGVLEACAMGLPVITTSVGGIPDLFDHGETALFVRDDDDEGMARSVQGLCSNPDLAALLSRNGRRLAECFSWEQVRPRWEQLFSELSGRREPATPGESQLGLGAGGHRRPHTLNPTIGRPADVRHLRHRSR
jgi:glycosyltransferase involved in cell wall biosynthesis